MGLLGEQFGGLFEVWGTLLEGSGGGLGELLAVLEGILGVLLPEKPSRIPEGVPNIYIYIYGGKRLVDSAHV